MFRFARLIRKYSTSYIRVRTGAGDYDEDGVFQPAAAAPETLLGVIQPVGMKLMELEGGRYTSDDRILYATTEHQTGDVIEYLGTRYKVESVEAREYSDVGKYMLKRVSSHDLL
ncbi:hypothetical protein [Paenibacillus caseinilyticus]|uniref:hypothetical protein n=1 Tax=Paenibacillus caseinilyticus TaxID=3098138 RepID=UPI0022B8F391|nr:hypothetical protein [Paenibacillus caseinilyticus]MCZ8518882.1 hypothetical protein [Paenibacillus caseinilyticus]